MIINSYEEYSNYWREHYAGASMAGAHILMRGHERPEYENLPTLSRLDFTTPQLLQFERDILKQFEGTVGDTNDFAGVALRPLNEQTPNLNIWLRLTQMRHLEFPSRLMDWTMTKEIALYFAVSQTKHHDVDGHIWFMVSPTGLGTMNGDERFIQKLTESYRHLNAGRDSMEVLEGIDPWNPAPTLLIHYSHAGDNWLSQIAERRRAAQGGKFIISPNDRFTIPLDRHFVGQLMRKVIIPADRKQTILEELEQRNFDAEHILPSLPIEANDLREKIVGIALDRIG